AGEELRRLGENAKVYAGGVELLLLMRTGLVEADWLVDIKHIPGMNDLGWDGQAMTIGACVTHAQLQREPLIQEHLPVLAEAEPHVGNIRVRSQGTLGGNLVFADPHADPATALLIHDPTVTLGGAGTVRRLKLAEFLVGTYDVDLQEGELLLDIRAEPLPAGWGTAFMRIEQFYRPTLNVAAAVHDGDVRLAVGCVGPRALRLTELEARLRGASPKDADALISASGEYLEELLEPVSDQLGSAEYKLHITKVVLGRALRRARERSH
ncbi:MAG: FAD binding domain-containing protein, partial [Chloroflexi bacterium]|nr:FAD binding domain-containing protein [Chloroflexota bacterium]